MRAVFAVILAMSLAGLAACAGAYVAGDAGLSSAAPQQSR